MLDKRTAAVHFKPAPSNPGTKHFVERLFCRLKDWRRVATRYGRKVSTYLATVTIAAIVMFWL
jgi:hypothetical protein